MKIKHLVAIRDYLSSVVVRDNTTVLNEREYDNIWLIITDAVDQLDLSNECNAVEAENTYLKVAYLLLMEKINARVL